MRVVVCIPAHGDPSELERTLTALAGVEHGDHRVDTIVAVDGPDPRLEAVATRNGAQVVVVDPPSGSYAARNAAIATIDPAVEAVMFTDAGCVPRPKWILAHLDALSTTDLSGGAVERTMSSRPTPAEYVDSIRNLTQRNYVEKDGFAVTANLAVKRAVLDEIRFDGTLRSGGDRDFCRRATAAGHRLRYTEDAVVEHDCRSTVAALKAKARRVGEGVAAMPAASRPSQLPRPRLGVALARRARRDGVSRNPVWLARVALAERARTHAFVAAAAAGGFVPGGDLDVVVFLGTRFDALQRTTTRWHHVVQCWTTDPSVGRVTVVDFPRAQRRLLAGRSSRLARLTMPTWLPGVSVVAATVPVGRDAGVTAPVAFVRAARAIERVLPAPTGPRVVVCASPLWAPVAAKVAADHRHFDAVDDQSKLPSLSARRRWVDMGYDAARESFTVSSVSPDLAEQLGGIHVGNGVDHARFRDATPSVPAAAGDRPFAVYVGVIQERVDLDLVAALGAALGPQFTVVIAGPASPGIAERLVSMPGVIHLGAVAPDDVPGLLRAATVGIVPHVVDPLTRSMDPLKILEYLAAGLPVVSTPVRIPDGTAGHVDVRDSTAGFIEAVRSHLESPTRHDGRVVAGRTWEAVARDLLALATPHIAHQGASA